MPCSVFWMLAVGWSRLGPYISLLVTLNFTAGYILYNCVCDEKKNLETWLRAAGSGPGHLASMGASVA